MHVALSTRIAFAAACLLCAAGCARGAGSVEGAAWSASPGRAAGIGILDGADGVTQTVSRGGAAAVTNRPGVTPASQYLYFNIDDARAQGVRGPIYLAVEYFDETLGGALQVHYDSTLGEGIAARYRPAEERAGGFTAGLKKWRRAYFALRSPRLANGQNLGADLRLTGTRLYIRALRLTTRRPSDWQEVAKVPLINVKPLVRIGPGGQLIVGGFDPSSAENAEAQAAALEASAPALKQLGVTSHEGYVRWNLCETAPGQYDWSVYDRFAEVYKRHGLKWVPFLIVGSPYSLPDWYYRKPGSQGYVCLEHGEESDVQSLWNPVLREHVARFIKAFCEHYRGQGVIESVLLGVTGNYGEAIYVATGNDWTADVHGPYHTHPGFWCGDPFALKDFRAWLQRKYADIGALNTAWKTSHGSFEAVNPFMRGAAASDRAWLDLCDWYIGSMTEWSAFWLNETRKNLPNGDIYLCTGGHAPPEHGADFGDQCKVAAAAGAGVRITNEASDYRANFSLTRWVAAAGRQYGAYFSFEPAGAVNANGVIARVYNATASGARGLHYYYPNLFDTDEARANFARWGSEFRQRKPLVEVAVYYPQTHIKLNGNDFLEYVQPLRDFFDFDYASDTQILDGALKDKKVLVVLHGRTSELAVWQAIGDWVRRGGVLVHAEGVGAFRTVEGNEEVQALLTGADNAGRGRIVALPGRGSTPEFRTRLARLLAEAPEVSGATRAMAALDGEEDGVFVTALGTNELLWLNYTPRPVRKGANTLEPWSIVQARAPGASPK